MAEENKKNSSHHGYLIALVVLVVIFVVGFFIARKQDEGPSIRPASLNFDSNINDNKTYEYDVAKVKNFKVNVTSGKATIYHVQAITLNKTKHFRGSSDKVNGFIRFFIRFNTNDSVEPKFGQAIASFPDDSNQMQTSTAGLVENSKPKANKKDLVFSNYNNWKKVDLDTSDTEYSIALPVANINKNHAFNYKVQYSIDGGKWQSSSFKVKF